MKRRPHRTLKMWGRMLVFPICGTRVITCWDECFKSRSAAATLPLSVSPQCWIVEHSAISDSLFKPRTVMRMYIGMRWCGGTLDCVGRGRVPHAVAAPTPLIQRGEFQKSEFRARVDAHLTEEIDWMPVS